MAKTRGKHISWICAGRTMLIVLFAGLSFLVKGADSSFATTEREKSASSLTEYLLALPLNVTVQPGGTDWNTASTWDSNLVPTSTDDVTIPSGETITITGSAVCQNLTIESGGTLILAAGATLTVNGSFGNNGTLDDSGTITLTAAGSTVSGTSTTIFNNLVIDAGANVSSVVTISSDVTVTSLNLLNGLLDIAGGTTSVTNSFNIPASAGLQVSAGGTLNTGDYTVNNKGLIRVEGGTVNFGIAADNHVTVDTGGAFIVNSGNVTIAGGLQSAAAGTLSDGGAGIQSGITINGGTIALATEGNGTSGKGSLDINGYAYFNFAGGTIVFENANSSSGTAVDLSIAAVASAKGTKTITGGAFQFGNANTTSGEYFVINSAITIPEIITEPNVHLELASDLDVSSSFSAGSGSLILLHDFSLTLPASSSNVTFNLVDSNAKKSSVAFSGIVGSGGAITLSMHEAQHPNDANSTNYMNRYWEINTNGISSYNVTALYPSAALSPNSTIYSSLVAASWDGTAWSAIGSVGSSSIIATGITSPSLSLAAIVKPTANLIGDTTICEGASATLNLELTGAANWNVVYTDGTSNYSLTGVTSAYNIKVYPSATTTYSLVSVSDANIAGTVTGTIVTVAVDEASVGGSISGGTNVCKGSNSTTLTLSGHIGDVVQWEYSENGGATWISVANTSTTYTATDLTVDTRYRVLVQNGSCSQAYSSVDIISVYAAPDATIAGTTTICADSGDAPITFTGTTGTAPFEFTYRLNGGSPTPLTSSGNSATVSQSSLVSGSYVYELVSVADAGGCLQAISGKTATVTVTEGPAVYNLTGGGSFCSGGGSASVGLDGSESGVMYQLYRDGSAVGGSIGGTGSAINFPNQSNAGVYTVKATDSGTTCLQDMAGTATVTVNPLPQQFGVTGGGSYCEGDAGVLVGLSGSVSGTSYQLYRNGTAVGTPVVGDGTAISFGEQTEAGSYTVIATNSTTGCERTMSGLKNVVMNASPTAILTVNGTSTNQVTIIAGQTATLWISFTGTGPFQYSINGGSVATNTGNPEKITLSPTATTQYAITSLRGAYCSALASELTSTVTIAVGELPSLTSATEAEVCSNDEFSYFPTADVDGCSFEWERPAVANISNAARSGNGPIDEVLLNTGTTPVNVPYLITITSPDGKENTASLNLTVYPSANLSYTISSQIVCEDESISIQATSTTADVTYSLSYASGSYEMQGLAVPTFTDNTTGSFSFIPVAGFQVYTLSATTTDGCSASYDIPVKIYGTPDLYISPSCFERSVTMDAAMGGSTDNPLNFSTSDLGVVEYSYDGGSTWTTDDYYGPDLPYGSVTVLGRNSAHPDCAQSITADIGFASAFANDVAICQGGESEAMDALSLCVEWDEASHVTKLDPDENSTYYVSSQDYVYSAGDEVSYAVTDIFMVDEKDGGFTFNDCNQKDYFSYSLYEYPFDPNNPEEGFLRLIPVGAACPKLTIDNLDPNSYYQLVINDYTLDSDVDVNVQFNQNDKPLFIKKTYSEVTWYDENGNAVAEGEEFDPVASGVIENTETPGDWSFYVSCGDESTCKEEVHFTIYPVPTATTSGTDVTCSGETTDIRIGSIDLYGNVVEPGLVTYTWEASNPDGLASGYTSCSSGCGSIIMDPVVNTSTQEAIVYYTITPHAGDCPATPITFELRVQPVPDVSIINETQIICPSDDSQIAPITLTLLNDVNDVSFVWNRTNTASFINAPAPPAIAESGDGLPDVNDQYRISGQLQSKYPNSLQQTDFQIEVQVAGHTCVENTASVTVGDEVAPTISCPETIEVSCYEDVPDGATSPEDFVAIDSQSAVSDNCTAFNEIQISYSDELVDGSLCNGNVRRTYRATDYAGNYSECTQEINILDTNKPSFVNTPAQNYSFCVNHLIEASHNGLSEPNTDITPNRPDYHILTDLEKETLANISFTDNCEAALHWSLLDSDNNPVRDDNSDLLSDKSDAITDHPITLQGDANGDRLYTLIYWLVDGCGNSSEMDFVIFIMVTPRPEIIRMNDSAFSGNWP
ncbi:carbohydrate-binding domain-containing protein [Mangrovibacterium lignilyticum]|uniref:carbohydrate-binding domain-containing protein n=1 Tax=Mangrovibacterium lignilyticum TaxID=2668052 RepID=UPI0013D1907E|nr:carbohydrate-binding domain-containing protein [Mangrovibacterium lignilyticum]